MAEGRNLLEVVLNTDIAKKFNAVDAAVDKIQKSMESAAISAEKFASALSEMSKSFGKSSDFGRIADNVEKLVQSLSQLNTGTSNKGLEQTQKEISSVGETANQNISNVDNFVRALNRLYNERLRYENEVAKLQTKATVQGIKDGTNGLPQGYEEAINKFNSLITEVQRKIDGLASKNKEAAKEASRLYDTKAFAMLLRQLEQYNSAIKKAKDELTRLNAEKQKEADKKIGIAGGEAPRTIREYELAIKNLRREIKNLDVDTQKSKIEEYNRKISNYEIKIQEATGATSKFVQESSKLNNVLQQVAGAFGVYIGLQSLTNFARNVAQVTGEFELQHRAMQAIIGDIDAANKLWDKTIRLAVKSPYSVKELVTYTKQLAAYRVETEKLYDTTKMLADISSGLGVDMQRLILAYGQVKAANYLRGQELRQFSEAGINILGELSKYFEEIKGQAVSTGEVFEMVSKRMVKFEDVSEVLRRMTQEGGIFFNMQEIQAETLRGMMMNLKDSLDIMRNEIGESNRGIIVSLVKAAKYLADNWKEVGNTLKWVSGLIIAFNIALKSARIQFAATNAIINGTTIQMTLLTRILALFNPTIRQAAIGAKSFSAAMGSIPGVGIVLAVLTALTGVLSSVIGKMKMAKEFQSELNKISTETSLSISKMTSTYKELAEKIKSTNTPEKERKELLEKMKRLYGEILPSRLLEIEYIKKEGNAYEEALQGIRAYYQEKRKERAIEATEKQYGETADTKQASAAKQLQNQIKRHTGIEISIKEINSIIGELTEQLRKGEIEADNFEESLAHLIKTQTGIDLTSSDIQTMTTRFRIMSTVYEKVREYLESILDYDRQIKDVTGSEEFGGVMAGAFENLVTRPAENAIAEYSEHLKGTFVEQGDELAKYTEQAFNHYFEEFKKSPYYKDNPDLQTYFENLFSQKITPKINDSKITDQIRGIRQMFDDAAEQIKVSNKSIFKEFLYDGKNTTKEYLDDLKKQLETRQIEQREIEGGIRTVKPEELKQLNDEVSVLEIVVKLLDAIYNPKKTGGNGNPALQLLNKQIDAIKNASKQYEEYKKRYEDTKAFEKTKEAVSDLFKELGISKALNDKKDWKDDTFAENVKEWLRGQMLKAGKDGKLAVEKYVSTIAEGFDEKNFKTSLDVFKKKMEEALSDYDMFSELKKLGIGKDFASILFGVDTNDIKQLRDALEKYKMANLEEYLGGTETTKAIDEMEKKITDIEDKEQKERLKNYVKYAKQAMTERAKIEVEGMAELSEIEKTFQAEIQKARGQNNEARVKELESLMQTAIAGSKKATDEKLQKQQLEDFKSSDLYIEMFNDIGNASEKVITAIQEKLSQLRGNLKELNPSDLKEITKQIQKMQDELDSRKTPAQNFLERLSKIRELRSEGKTEESLSSDLLANESLIESYNELIATNEKWLKQREENSKQLVEEEGEEQYFAMNNSLRSMIANWNNIIKQKQKDNVLTQEQLDDYKKFKEAAKAYADAWQNSSNRIGAIFNDIMSNLEAFGGETTNTTQAWGDMGETIMGIVGMIPNYILMMKAAGVASKEALGVVGWVLIGVETLVALIKGIANINNAAIDDEIENYQKQIDKLSDAYDSLERSFDRAWNIEKLREYNSDMESSIRKQIALINQQIEAESRRKSPDQSVIDDYNKQINDLHDTLEDRRNEWLERVSGFGDEGTWDDATQGFIDAWYDAFKETGDGLEGLKENFNEVLENMVKKQAALRIANAIMKPLYEMINNAAEDGTITNSEMAAIVSKAEETFPELNEKLKAFFQSLGLFGEQAAGELDGLQKGIQGVTEQTAEIIAAYMNSIRYYVIDNNTKIGQLISIFQDGTGAANPMLNELRNIKTHTANIENFLSNWNETTGVQAMRVTIV